ncbi:MAG: SUMF1/EgtB/PvdO family nonheme iron enzyme, partial [Planctomycetota bacterium]
LELILQKALEVEPERRYSSAGGLESDLRRLLDGRPIVARAASVSYRGRLFLRRNRVTSAAVGAVVLGLTIGLVLSLLGLDRARRAEAETERAALLFSTQDLERRARNLWPALPDQIEPMESWIEDAERVRDGLAPELATWLPTEIGPNDDGSNRTIESIAADLFDPARRHGGLRDVRDRLERARRVRAETVQAHADSWRAALDRIRTDRRFEGLTFEPQVGLVPLGPDPRSGLEEFGLWGQTGELPRRDSSTGELIQDHRSAVILVLLPGGRFRAGAQDLDPALPRYDAKARSRHEWLGEDFWFDLDPFLIAKYELTHHQFRGVAGYDPSFWQPGEVEREERVPVSSRAPVETITQPEARAFCQRLGLDLPTSVQHEYATRGGTQTRYWWGDRLEDGAGKVATRWYGVDAWWIDDQGEPRHWDCYDFACPTGMYSPNPFGLYDMVGGIREWCREVFWVERPVEEIDRRSGEWLAVRNDPFGNHYGVRGCSFVANPSLPGRSSARSDTLGRESQNTIGFRAARNLHGPWTRMDRDADNPGRHARRAGG